MAKTRAGRCALLAVAMVVVVGCGSDDNGGAAAPSDSPTPTVTESASRTPPPGLTNKPDLTVTMTGVQFDPKTVNAKANTGYDLVLLNPSALEHTFTVDALKVDASVPKRTDIVVSFKAPKAGRFELRCTLHIEMTGTVVVT